MARTISNRDIQKALLSALEDQKQKKKTIINAKTRVQDVSDANSFSSNSTLSTSDDSLSEDSEIEVDELEQCPPPSNTTGRTSKKAERARGEKHSKENEKADRKSLSEESILSDQKIISKLRDLLSTTSKTITKQTRSRGKRTESLSDVQPPTSSQPTGESIAIDLQGNHLLQALLQAADKKQNTPAERGSKVEFRRLDQVYNKKTHNFELLETVNDDTNRNEWDQYVFTIRRTFDVNGRYTMTQVDFKSKPLKECLQKVMGSVKGINLVTDTPSIEPNLLFLYLEEFRDLREKLKGEIKHISNKDQRKAVKVKVQHLKVMIKYLDQDYAETKKSLYPMLEAGIISFEYLWALFKPNTIIFSSTYGDEEEPRAFKIEQAREKVEFMRGKYFSLTGRYLEYDGKDFGMAALSEEIDYFQGARKITSLPCYPLQYHKAVDELRSQLIERGKKFATLQGMNYKGYSGMAYVKKKSKVLKVDVNGRIMIDPAIFRRTNPNYPLSQMLRHADDEDDDEPYNDGDSGMDSIGQPTPNSEDFEKQKHFKAIKDDNGDYKVLEMDLSDEINNAPAGLESEGKASIIFSEDQLLIASPVVLGFSFTEKLWLEFAISKITEVQWNDGAFDSLILPENQKSIVKALVSSHVFHPSRSIDDIIAGKGKGLVAVLHGPPGVGKTLTAESIADLLRKPLYVVSAGDLGTDSRTLESQLQNILDIAHAWSAVLLLDEADVFLEKRSNHEIHRNALVSIFLRLLEYFQGILFLTTNRVEVFDDAFVSRIHLSLRYGDLSTKAKKAVWKTFINKVQTTEGLEVELLTEADYDDLARRSFNGRQIKNIVRTAQAIAVNSAVPLSMTQIKTVIDVAQSFERDLKGGTGYEDAMRGYT